MFADSWYMSDLQEAIAEQGKGGAGAHRRGIPSSRWRYQLLSMASSAGLPPWSLSTTTQPGNSCCAQRRDEGRDVDQAALGAELEEPALDPAPRPALEHRGLGARHQVFLAGVGKPGVLEVHVGHPLGVRRVEGHRVDAADGQLGGVQREARPVRGR